MQGNVNLRTCFADINQEAMFPIHCAVLGGSLELVKWLVDVQLVPIVGPTTTTTTNSTTSNSNHIATNYHHHHHHPYSGLFGGFNVRQQQQHQQQQSTQQQQPLFLQQSVQTSASRTLLDLAMTGRPKVDILIYLIAEKGLRINDVKDPQLAPKTLETLLLKQSSASLSSSGFMSLNMNHGSAAAVTATGAVHVVLDNGNEQDSVMSSSSSSASMEDACCICFERQMDCVLIPCGHQVCCTECGQQVRCCPICKVDCSVLRIFRQ
jgi:Zinc finger, C3HC4 type (RING finger)